MESGSDLLKFWSYRFIDEICYLILEIQYLQSLSLLPLFMRMSHHNLLLNYEVNTHATTPSRRSSYFGGFQVPQKVQELVMVVEICLVNII